MDSGSSTNVIEMFPDITLSDGNELAEGENARGGWTELLQCDAVQGLATLLADCSFLRCLSLLRVAALKSKYRSRYVTRMKQNKAFFRLFLKFPSYCLFLLFLLLHFLFLLAEVEKVFFLHNFELNTKKISGNLQPWSKSFGHLS